MDKQRAFFLGVEGTLLSILVTNFLSDINLVLLCVVTVVTAFLLSLTVPVCFGSRIRTVALIMTITILLVILLYFVKKPPFPLSITARNAFSNVFPGIFIYGYINGSEQFAVPLVT